MAGTLTEKIPVANNLAVTATATEISQQPSNQLEVGDVGVVGNELKKRKTIPLPLEVGTGVMCRWRDGKLHSVKVIEWRKLSTGLDDYQYYVHYTEFNRRLNEWVELDQLELELEYVEAEADEIKLKEKVSELRMTRRQKQKIEETHPEEVHEKFTKVKSINKIELGRYEIDTSYFSPFQAEYRDCIQLFFCKFCLTFLKRKEQLARHIHPAGRLSFLYSDTISLGLWVPSQMKQRLP